MFCWEIVLFCTFTFDKGEDRSRNEREIYGAGLLVGREDVLFFSVVLGFSLVFGVSLLVYE